MDSTLLSNLTDPAILFFVVGVLIGSIRSNLEIPAPVTKFLSLYLLMAIGFKGGQALSQTGLSGEGLQVVGVSLLLAVAMPAILFPFLRRKISHFDAAAIAATYGSVSAVTFVTASQFLISQGDEAGGYLTVALVVMESPAIIMAVLLASYVRSQLPAKVDNLVGTNGGKNFTKTPTADGEPVAQKKVSMRAVLHEAFTDGAHLLLILSMAVGFFSGAAGGEAMAPFVTDLFKGVLAFFLLDMGLLVARQLRQVRDVGPFLIAVALVTPLVGATLALGISTLLGFSVGDATLLAVLAASGSYIVVPAVLRSAIPEARPSRYFTMSLAVTFPFNIIVGIPLYYFAAQLLLG
jgi:hypothetical protein